MNASNRCTPSMQSPGHQRLLSHCMIAQSGTLIYMYNTHGRHNYMALLRQLIQS